MRIAGVLIGAVILGFIYFTFNPAHSAFFPKCPFFYLSGLKCPGCGSQRAVHALLHLDFVTAFKHNALLILSIPIISILGYAELRRTKKPLLYLKLHNVLFIWGYFMSVICWWIGRNIFNV